MGKNQDSSKEFIWGKRKNKKWIIILIAVGVVIAGVTGYFIFGFNVDNSVKDLLTSNGKDNSDLARRSIDGVYVSLDQVNNYPVAVMIENLVSSRPPSGLAQANLVYEALAEGGITRFMAMYAGHFIAMPEIGPVRSARPYYIDWALEFDALYAHVGGSPQSFSDIREYNVFDLNQFYNSQYFWRDSERFAPHNLYTSGEKLAFALRDLEAESEGNYNTWNYKDDISLSNRPTEDKNIIIEFSSFNYQVEYKYDREQNDYLRYQAGEIHKDKDGTEIRTNNVIVQKVKTSLIGESRLSMETIGGGEALIFFDGLVISGSWDKEKRGDRTRFYDEDGEEVLFNAGTTWIEVVPTDRNITYN